MKKLALILGLFIVIAFIYSGCRKGEDDPWLSFRSRTQRLVGKWKLVEQKEINLDETIQYYNYIYYNVNKSFPVKYDYTKTEYNLSKNGAEKSSQTTKYRKSLLLLGDTLNLKDSILTLNFYQIKNKGKYTGTYTTIIDIKADHTYEITQLNDYSFNLQTNSNFYSYYYYCSDGLIQGGQDSGTTNSLEIVKNNSTRYGNWQWEDKDKLYINIGDIMKGKLKRLSNNEIIIEDNLEFYYEQNGYQDVIINDAIIKECVTNYYSMDVQQYIGKYFVQPNKQLYHHTIKKYVYQRWERIKD